MQASAPGAQDVHLGVHPRAHGGPRFDGQKAEAEPPRALLMPDIFPDHRPRERPGPVGHVRQEGRSLVSFTDAPSLLLPHQQRRFRNRRVEIGSGARYVLGDLLLKYGGIARDDLRRFRQVARENLGHTGIEKKAGQFFDQECSGQRRAESIERKERTQRPEVSGCPVPKRGPVYGQAELAEVDPV